LFKRKKMGIISFFLAFLFQKSLFLTFFFHFLS